MNKVILFGRLVENPVLKMTESGKAVCSIRIAVSRSYNREKTDFINCVAWQKTAELLCEYTQKGDMLGLVGRIEGRSWTDSDGAKRYATEVNVEELQFANSVSKKKASQTEDGFAPGAEYPSGDELPFNM